MSDHRDIALALSGGGYRAAYFNLGVMQKLHELGLLDRIGVISSVSGGSILAGLYATSLLEGDSFGAFVACCKRFFDRAVSLDWPVLFHDLFLWSDSSRGLERGLQRQYVSDGRQIMMTHLDGLQPKFVINATAVHSGAGWRFRGGGIADHWELGHTHGSAFEVRLVEYDCDVPLAKAVAASAAFPTFSAVAIPRANIRETGNRSTVDASIAAIVPQLSRDIPDPLCLSDGGVLDNIGVTSILAGMAPAATPDGYYLIASDGGGVPQQLNPPPRGRLFKLRYVMRQFDMRGRHNNMMTSFLALRYHRREVPTKGCAMLNINEVVPHAGETFDDIATLTSIKTRLSRIPTGGSTGLMRHGANLAWSRVSEYMPELLPSDLIMPGTVPQPASDP